MQICSYHGHAVGSSWTPDPMPANTMPPDSTKFHGALKRQAGTFALLYAVENGY